MKRRFVYELYLRRRRRVIQADWVGRIVRTRHDIAAVVEQILPQDGPRERFIAFFLTRGKRLIGFEEFGTGTPSDVYVAVAEVFRSALISGAEAVIVAHNHTEDAKVSSNDKELTRRLESGAEVLGLEFLDHIVLMPSHALSIYKEET